jgi:hypothetical protein
VLEDVVDDDVAVLELVVPVVPVPLVDVEVLVVLVVLGPVPSSSSSQPGTTARAATSGIRTSILIEPPPRGLIGER